MEGNDPRYMYQDTGGSMRAFLIVILFFLAFLLFASGVMGNTDLTSNRASAASAPVQPVAPVVVNPVAADPQVITIQETPITNDANALSIPVTGTCTNPYTVRSGDILSQIAVTCDTTIAAIRQANPQVTDANMIYPGQQLVIPNAVAAPPQPVVPVTGDPSAKMIVPVTGIYPMIATGTGLQVKGIGFPPNTPVNVAIGPQSTGYTVVTSGVTDAAGNLTTRITIPTAPDSQTPWVVVVATTTQPAIQAMSQPFNIGPTAQ